MKLWEKGYQLHPEIEAFMTGDDPILDRALIPYDCIGSIAHALMLKKIAILSASECQEIVSKLSSIYLAAEEFVIQPDDEDVHTAIESALGSLGKKLHTARSRNDQILVDLRLYMKQQILLAVNAAIIAGKTLASFAATNHAVPIPGRTHFQRAMPSSLGLWAGAFSESLLDDIRMLQDAYRLIDQCPLGSAASYGVSLPIDRQYVSDLLGFSKVQNNVLYANNSRGKFEAAVLHTLVQTMNDLSKLAVDIIFFSIPEFGYLRLPEQFCPGSSLMPQKRNPCFFELIRAKAATLQSLLYQVLEIIRGLPSGYNRDFQETKRPLMFGFDITIASLKGFSEIFPKIMVDKEKCIEAFSPELFATDQVLHLSKKGMPFRLAYQKVAENCDSFQEDPVTNILGKTHLGATGNLQLPNFSEEQNWMHQEIASWGKVMQILGL